MSLFVPGGAESILTFLWVVPTVVLILVLPFLLADLVMGGAVDLFVRMRAKANREDGLEPADERPERSSRPARQWPEWVEQVFRMLAGLIVLGLLMVFLIPNIQMQALRTFVTGLGLAVMAVLVVELIFPVDITGFIASLARRDRNDRDR